MKKYLPIIMLISTLSFAKNPQISDWQEQCDRAIVLFDICMRRMNAKMNATNEAESSGCTGEKITYNFSNSTASSLLCSKLVARQLKRE